MYNNKTQIYIFKYINENFFKYQKAKEKININYFKKHIDKLTVMNI